MSLMLNTQMRWCNSCMTERELREGHCENIVHDGQQGLWDLSREPARPRGWRPRHPAVGGPDTNNPMEASLCENGHAMSAGDLLARYAAVMLPSPAALVKRRFLLTSDPRRMRLRSSSLKSLTTGDLIAD